MESPLTHAWLPATLEATLLTLAAACGALWLILLRVRRGADRSRRLVFLGFASTCGLLLGRTWLVEPFFVPSASMAPTLLEGDLLLVQKFPYRLAWPIVGTTLWTTGTPERGEIVVFTLVENPEVHYVKRVVGVGGDDVLVVGEAWFVNAQEMSERPQGFFGDSRGSAEALGRQRRQTQLGRYGFEVLAAGPPVNRDVRHWKVPAGHVFVLGDNRGLSRDSRDFGPVPVEQVLGRATRVAVNLHGWDRWAIPLGGKPTGLRR